LETAKAVSRISAARSVGSAEAGDSVRRSSHRL